MIFARRTALALACLGLTLVLAAPAGAAVTNPVKIPGKVKAKGKGANFVMRNGNRLEITLNNSRAGKKLRKQIVGKRPIIRCSGVDALNTTAYELLGDAKWKKGKGRLVVHLHRRIVPAYCGIGISLNKMTEVFFGLIDIYTDPTPPVDAQYAAQFQVLLDLTTAQYDASVVLDNQSATPQQLIDQIVATGTYTPPMPMLAMASDAAAPAAGSLGIWTDLDELRSSETATDGTPLWYALIAPGLH